ncbi:hypothetical protein KIKIMORA_02430 [Brevundimonas phage vB_BpoS-Kikimora]|uniref:Uncharacterized protein n=1 Tax=Brevundimonas phage vB_BpoS-Kikimora TaxID=2948601 RepID=A0A9E7MS18_9CAUD|nr:hypothetical protein KIKIMORA_02430 [Brevundimonas phage vB_BpoS-Kikimora]
MTEVTRKATTAQAWQFTRQPKKDWPTWVQDYQVHTPLGPQSPGLGAGVLLLPTKNGPTINVTDGEWLVQENGALLVFRDETFHASFDLPADAVQAAAPAEAPAPEAPTKPAKGDKKPAGDKPAEDAPAAEA